MREQSILFLCSGGGGNLRFIHRVLKNNWLPRWSRIVVVADRECPATEYAREESLTTSCIDFTANEQNDLLQTALLENPDIIITTVHRILRAPLLNAFDGRLLNLHYSLLPSFGGSIGTNPVRAAMAYGACLAGATVHQVTEALDGGQPQVQVAVPLSRDDTLGDIMDVVFRSGCIALFTALKQISDASEANWKGANLHIKDRNALINPSVQLPAELADNTFWQSLKQ